MVGLTTCALTECRARIARLVSASAAPVTLGDVTLRPHQREALARVTTRLDRHGGCLLADDVGRGKTFVALAAARRWCRPLVVVPAALRDTWTHAMRRAQMDLPLQTHEALSRGRRPAFEPDGIVVDESQHFRNPATKRYAHLADLSLGAELLLLSATPIQNREADLAAQVALWLGSAALRLGATELAAHVVRVASGDDRAELPALAPPRWVHVGAEDADVLRAILSLPPPPRALDAGDAGALRTLSLVRAWASSRAALAAMLARRRRVVTAFEQAVDAGRVPTLAELRSWSGIEEVQLGFAPLLVEACGTAPALAQLRAAVDAELAALRQLGALVRAQEGIDAARAGALLDIARAHAGQRVVAFTERAATARAYFAELASRPGAALLSASEARIASGRLTRRELLARFAPAARGLPEPPMRERITLLVCTDLLSEGVNLQDASVVVHLDLPWNPARLAQRVGRARRPGGPVAEVTSYLLAPPADAELLLEVEDRLRRKLAVARRAMGDALIAMPPLTLAGIPTVSGSAPITAGDVHARIAAWAGDDRDEPDDEPPRAAALAEERGWLAALPDGRLVACVAGEAGDDPAILARAIAHAGGPARDVRDDEQCDARSALAAWLRTRALLDDCGASIPLSDVALRVGRHAARLLTRAPRHERATLASRVAPLRARLARPLPLGAERALERWMAGSRDLPVDEWLAGVAAILARCPSSPPPGDPATDAAALLVFGPAR